MGGTDDPSNLIELTIEEHAEAHRILYETYGKVEDKVAWQSLAGLVPKAELMRELHQLGRRKADNVLKEKYGVTNPGQLPNTRKATSDRLKRLHSSDELSDIKFHNRADFQQILEKAKSAETIKKRKATFNKIQHQKGTTNSQFGTMWITDSVSNKKIQKDSAIPEGWRKGRTC